MTPSERCKKYGTGQCAAICLSKSSYETTQGKCPFAPQVWTPEKIGLPNYVETIFETTN